VPTALAHSRRARLASAGRYTGPPMLAAAACIICWAAGWRGTDWAAQIYRAEQVSRYGLALWDPGWYGGTFPLGYSLVLPLAGAYLGLWPLAAVSAAGAAFCFDRLVRSPAGRPLGSWYFALLTFVPIAIGQLPTLAGEAFALGSVLCFVSYSRRPAPYSGRPALYGLRAALYRRRAGAWFFAGLGLGVMAGLSTPVAGSFLAMALVAWGTVEARQRLIAVAGVLVLGASAALPLAFFAPGWFPFSFSEAVPVVLIAALVASPLLDAPRPVRAAGAFYVLVTALLWAVRTPMGDNDARLAAYVGVPVVLCYLPRFVAQAGRARVAALVAAAAAAGALAVWDWAPAVEAFGGATNGATSVPSYYAPLARELSLLARGLPVKVEVPPLAHHWESAYLAPLVPLARGWERQLDLAYAPLFYRPLGPGEYVRWLRANGVSYVALANAPLDYAGTAEASLLRSGHLRGLAMVWRDKFWQLWKVNGSPGLATPPATVVSLGPDKVVVRFSTPGESTLKLRWAQFWSLAPSEAALACVRKAPSGWTLVASAKPLSLRIGVSLLGADHGNCPRPGPRRRLASQERGHG
jgi:hypothetical protein